MAIQNKALCQAGLTEIFDVLVDELTNNKLIPELNPSQRNELIASTVMGVTKACGDEGIDDPRKALNLEVDMQDDKESVCNLMNAFKSVLIAECALNPEVNKDFNKDLKNVFDEMQKNPELSLLFKDGKLLDNPAFKLLFEHKPENEKGEKDENKTKDKLKNDLKVELKLLLAAMNPKLDPKVLDKQADDLANKIIAKCGPKPGNGQSEKEDMLAKNREAVEMHTQLGMTLASEFGVNPLLPPGSNQPVIQEVLTTLSSQGIPDVTQGGGLNEASQQNTENFGADPNQTKAATLMNAVSSGIPVDTSAEVDSAITGALRLTIPTPKNTR